MSTDTRGERPFAGMSSYIRNSNKVRLGLLLGLPSAFLLLFFFSPLVSMLHMSFLESTPPAPFTLENYLRIFNNDTYLTILWRTLVLSVQATVVVSILGYMLAYSIVRFSKRSWIMLLLLILPFWTNYIVRMYALINVFQSGGLLSTVLVTLGLQSGPSGIMYTHSAVMLGLAYVWLPLATFPFYASLTGMNSNLIDASKDLGAGPIETFFRITLPLTKNGVIGGVILVAIPAFGSFVTPSLLGGTSITMIGMTIESQFTSAFNWPFGAALGVVVTVIVLGLLLGSYLLSSSRQIAGGGGQ